MQFRPVDARPGMLANPHVQQWTRGAEEAAGTREAAKTEQDTRRQSFDAGRAGPSTAKKRTAPTKASKTASTKRVAKTTKKASRSQAAARARKSSAKKTTTAAKASKKTGRRNT
jgi:DNA-binding protein HU-beta